MRKTSVLFGGKLNDLLRNMPKQPNHIGNLQKQRIKMKERSSRYPPSRLNLQFLSPSTGPSSVYLFSDQSRYLFNCGEGTQRLAHEHKTKVARLDHIFMTRTSWGNIGGLPGLCLTVQDSGVPELTLHGPPGLDEIFRAASRFVVLRDLKVKAVEGELGGGYDDCVMSVEYVPIHSSSRSSQDGEEETIAEDTEDYFAHERGRRLEIRTSGASKTLKRRNETSVMAYVCKLKPRTGTLDLDKCVERRVPTGPLLGQLKNGFDVKLEDGTVVMAKDVRGPDDPGPKFIFVDIPNEDYLEDLETKTHLLTAEPNVVVHLTNSEMLSHPRYRAFVSQFPSTCQHLSANGKDAFTGYVAAHRIQWQLNQLDAGVFPLLGEAKYCKVNESCEQLKKKARLEEEVETRIEEESLIQPTCTQTIFHLRPSLGLERGCESTLSPSEYVKELEVIEGCPEVMKQVKSEISERDRSTFPRILFLGTGSCIPNKTRNVSSILIRVSADSSILLDSGEGTVAQILRFFGPDEAPRIFKSLRAIYVSHLHADHHLGLIGVLQERHKHVTSDPVFLFAPIQIASWLSFYDRRIEPIESLYRLVPNADLLEAPFALPSGETVRTCLVRHCPHSFGVAVGLQHDLKITYSGDTTPCRELVDLGRDSTILIHEATMEDDLEDEAKFKMHSTTSQAISQGELMGAKYTLLTHFSQRYSKLPRFEFETLKENVGIAFDNMEVTLADLPVLHKFYPALKSMFAEHVDHMDQKALKRAFRKEQESGR